MRKSPTVNNELAIYLHWPFCQSKCPYCDFNSYVFDTIDQASWRRAYLAELDRVAAVTADRRVSSVFFGGGTPSLMDPATIAAILRRVAERWDRATDLEVTAEVNPSSAEAGLFRDFRQVGVNRLSLGVQSFRDQALRFLGRRHDAAEARAAVSMAASVMDRYSFDLIYALPGQSVAQWRKELGEALLLAGEHVSVYQLTIEPGTAFHAQGMAPAAAGPGAEMFEATNEMLAAGGLAAYEISNHARPGGQCRHNLTYWRGGDYVGIGPGAHSRLTLAGTRRAVSQIVHPQAWLEAVEEKGTGEAENICLTPGEWLDELLLMGLRLTAGISRADFAAKTGMDLEASLRPENLRPLVNGGFLQLDAEGLRATPAGRLRLDSVLSRLLA